MKYLITESLLERTVFDYLNSKNLRVITQKSISGGKLYDKVYFTSPSLDKFTSPISDKFALIRYDSGGEWDGWCFINNSLINEVNDSLKLKSVKSEKESNEYLSESIGKWIEETFHLRVSNIVRIDIGKSKDSAYKLKIYK